ncbi:MAG: FAD-binding protein [gamma proteobacterium symbiont of Bathyaustriella thionipta]|nr:FAD-binding protein [gamma proteobacterium symbiont of Bathyaustriella thionipta]
MISRMKAAAHLLEKLIAIVGHKHVLSRDEELIPYECDGLSAYRVKPMLVVLPADSEQVQAVVRCCHQYQTPIVARGAGTGLSGGALPLQNGVLLSLARLNQILQIDVVNTRARVQPGVRNLAVSEAARPHGLYYAPDPSSQIACSIGGNVAENAGGVHCLKYGLTVNNLLALKVITVDGELLELGGGALDSAGLDLLSLMTGSEGMLGIVVEITLRLLPLPQQTRTLMASFEQLQQAGNAVADIIASGIIPAGLEIMDRLSIQAAEDFIHAGYPTDAAAILLCDLDGTAADVETDYRQLMQTLQNSGSSEIRQAHSGEERQRMWAGRKAAFPAVGRISPDYYCMDGTIPRKYLGEILQHIDSLSQHYKLRVANVFHAGDGNLHPLILYDANQPGELQHAEEFGGKILELCVRYGGSITGEHGVGMEKINQMCVQFSSDELNCFHELKSAFDPDGLLNPGKAIPTLVRCAEFGAMHVHNGQLAHPELERF